MYGMNQCRCSNELSCLGRGAHRSILNKVVEDSKRMVWWLTSGCWKVFYAYDSLLPAWVTFSTWIRPFALGKGKKELMGCHYFL